MKTIIINIIFFLAFSVTFSQVANDNETNFPQEGSINESIWNSYLLQGIGSERTLRLGVSNDGYTRGEIEIENNNTSGGSINLKTTNVNGGAVGRMFIASNGKVGIGTTNPSANLEIKGGNGVAISLQNDQANYWDIVNSTFGKLDFVRGKSNIYMRIDQFGNMGIGTTTPDSKLSVNGNIHTKEVKVDLIDWSDFVFSKDYDLPTLKEVEQHIKEKGHLKDIPSAEEVKENGIFLGEMDSKLLQKIEELTLYTIDQENRIETLEDKNEKLIALVEKLISKKIEE